jgi:hypothetical protein
VGNSPTVFASKKKTRIKVRDCSAEYPLIVPWMNLTHFALFNCRA